MRTSSDPIGAYLDDLVRGFWRYRETEFTAEGHVFESTAPDRRRPPIFLASSSPGVA